MDRGKQTRSGSSLASDLFGSAKDAAADSSPGIFSAAEINKKKNPKSAVSLSGKKGSCGESHSRSSTFEPYPEDKIKPYHYGSSIYYGAQDVYFEPESTQKHGSSSSSSSTSVKPRKLNPPHCCCPFSNHSLQVKKDGNGEDMEGGAVRGNWWQGSLYY